MVRYDGVLLIGGSGSRLRPTNFFVNKHFLPIAGKPMFFYPLTNLLLAGCRKIILVGHARDLSCLRDFFRQYPIPDISFEYAVQTEARGIVDALLTARPYCEGRPVTLALGDNLFFAEALTYVLLRSSPSNAIIYSILRGDTKGLGVLERGPDGAPLGIIEKPIASQSSEAVVGLYKLPSDWVDKALSVRASARGEYEITDLLNAYIDQGQLEVEHFGRCSSWVDCGTYEGIDDANHIVGLIKKTGLDVGDPWNVALPQ